MKVIKNTKRIVAFLLIIGFVFTAINPSNFVNAVDITSPVLTITGGSTGTVQKGSTLVYTLTYTDNVAITRINLTSSDIILNGFNGNISIYKNGNIAKVTVSNIASTTNGTKFIIVKSGTAEDAQGNVANRATSDIFLMPTTTESKDTTLPTVSISGPSISNITSGGSVEYTLTASDNVGISKIAFNSNTIILNGFTASETVTRLNNTSAKLTLNNITGTAGSKNITVTAGSVTDTSSNLSAAVTSFSFNLTVNNTNINTVSVNGTNNNTNTITTNNNKNITTETPTVTNTVTYGTGIPYEANKEITYFSTWLKSKVDNSKTVQENNYAADNKTMTYFVDYYNGLSEEAKNVKIMLNIPLNVEIVEVSGNGKIVENNQTSNKVNTTIEWNLESVASLASERISVKVKFLKDTELSNSNEISKIFYPELVTTLGDKTTYSYLRQIFVDNSVTKVGSFAKSLMFIDRTNSIRQNDEITRAEFAKMITDLGIIKLDYSTNKYMEYTDYKEIPTFARVSVSSLKDKNIFSIDDNNFSPNNPIIRDEFMKMLVNVLTYISDSKIKADKAIYLDNYILECKDKTISENKDYIMELARLNVIPEYETNLKADEYITRGEAIALLNAIAFKSNTISNSIKYSLNTMKINNLKYIYNFTSSNNTKSYNYIYDENLNQVIK
jgi:hypothetical protein